MAKTLQVIQDRAYDDASTVLPVEYARGLYVENPPSAAALKLMHLLIAKAGGALAEDRSHSFRLADLRAVEGMKNHDRATLRPLFVELAAAVMVWDDTEAQNEVIGGFMDRAKLDYRHEISDDLIVTWWFGGAFREMAEKSNLWAILDRQTVFALSSKYSILLFQHFASLQGLEHKSAKAFTLPELRTLLGVPAGKLVRWTHLNRDALQPAIAEINQLARFTLTTTVQKVGRSVSGVTISWEPKPDPTDAKRELARPKVGRKARRDGTAEAPAPAFPENGSIRWTSWEALVWEHAPKPTPDMELVGAKFRDFCAGRGLPLTAAGIEKTFVAWVSKFRVG